MTLADPMKAAYPRTGTLLGIDIGSVTICVVRTDLGEDPGNGIPFPQRQIRECLRTAGAQIGLESVRGIAACAAPCFDPEKVVVFNPQVALIRAAKMLSPQAKSLLLVGAEKFSLIRFDDLGNFESARSNSSCAAGTGSFLDQQALRLNLQALKNSVKSH